MGRWKIERVRHDRRTAGSARQTDSLSRRTHRTRKRAGGMQVAGRSRENVWCSTCRLILLSGNIPRHPLGSGSNPSVIAGSESDTPSARRARCPRTKRIRRTHAKEAVQPERAGTDFAPVGQTRRSSTSPKPILSSRSLPVSALISRPATYRLFGLMVLRELPVVEPGRKRFERLAVRLLRRRKRSRNCEALAPIRRSNCHRNTGNEIPTTASWRPTREKRLDDPRAGTS